MKGRIYILQVNDLFFFNMNTHNVIGVGNDWIDATRSFNDCARLIFSIYKVDMIQPSFLKTTDECVFKCTLVFPNGNQSLFSKRVDVISDATTCIIKTVVNATTPTRW